MKRLILLPLLFLFSFANANEFIIDTSHSHVGFSVKHLMISKVKGEFKIYEADIDFDTKENKFNKLAALITANSIYTGDEKRDAHLKSADFFESAKFPDIKFVATDISDDEIKGQLTIKDITKEITLKLTLNGVTKFRGDTRFGFSLEGKIDRKDFGLTWNKALEAGGVLVGDDVKIDIEIEAIEL